MPGLGRRPAQAGDGAQPAGELLELGVEGFGERDGDKEAHGFSVGWRIRIGGTEMCMEALYSERGVAYAWLHANGVLYGLDGKALAFADDDGVYDWEGRHIAWWADGHIRDRIGAVCLFTKASTKTLVVKPVVELHQQRPLRLEIRQRPLKWPKMARPPKLCIWTKEMPF